MPSSQIEDKESNNTTWLRAMAEALEGMIAFLKKMQGPPPPPEPPAEQIYAEAYKNLDNDTLSFEITYKRNNKLYPFVFPVFLNLQEKICTYRPKIKPPEEVKIEIVTKEGWFDTISKFIPTKTTVLLSAVLFLSRGFLRRIPMYVYGFSTFAGVIAIRVFNYQRKREAISIESEILDNLYALSDDISAYDLDNADLKLGQLQYLLDAYSMLADPKNIKDLQWSYHYLEGLRLQREGAAADYIYDEAIKSANSENERLLTVIGLINAYSRRIEIAHTEFKLKEFSDDPEENKSIYDEVVERNTKKLHAWLFQVPEDYPKIEEMCFDIQWKLESCLNLLREQRWDDFEKAFLQIKLDGFTRLVFPAAKILYQQLEILRTVFKPLDKNSRLINTHDVLYNLDSNLMKIHDDLLIHYPERVNQHAGFITEYRRSCDAIHHAYRVTTPSYLPYASTKFRLEEETLPVNVPDIFARQFDLEEDEDDYSNGNSSPKI